MTLTVRLCGQAALLPEPPETAPWPKTLGPVRLLSGLETTGPKGMERWGRLDRYGRALATACARSLDNSPAPAPEDTGLFVSSLYSCLETNSRYDAELIEKGPARASPILFPYTLPGAAASEVAAWLELTGPYLVFPGGAASSLASLLGAAETIADERAAAMLVASADVLGVATAELISEQNIPAPAPPLAEAAAAAYLAAPDDALAGPIVRLEGALAGNPETPVALTAQIDEALGRAGLDESSVAQIAFIADAERAPALVRQSITTRFAHLAAVDWSWRLGRAGAPVGLLAALAVIQEGGPGLVIASERGRCAVLAIAHSSLWNPSRLEYAP